METSHKIHTAVKDVVLETNIFTKKMNKMSVSYRKNFDINAATKKWVVFKVVSDEKYNT